MDPVTAYEAPATRLDTTRRQRTLAPALDGMPAAALAPETEQGQTETLIARLHAMGPKAAQQTARDILAGGNAHTETARRLRRIQESLFADSLPQATELPKAYQALRHALFTRANMDQAIEQGESVRKDALAHNAHARIIQSLLVCIDEAEEQGETTRSQALTAGDTPAEAQVKARATRQAFFAPHLEWVSQILQGNEEEPPAGLTNPKELVWLITTEKERGNIPDSEHFLNTIRTRINYHTWNATSPDEPSITPQNQEGRPPAPDFAGGVDIEQNPIEHARQARREALTPLVRWAANNLDGIALGKQTLPHNDENLNAAITRIEQALTPPATPQGQALLGPRYMRTANRMSRAIVAEFIHRTEHAPRDLEQVLTERDLEVLTAFADGNPVEPAPVPENNIWCTKLTGTYPYGDAFEGRNPRTLAWIEETRVILPVTPPLETEDTKTPVHPSLALWQQEYDQDPKGTIERTVMALWDANTATAKACPVLDTYDPSSPESPAHQILRPVLTDPKQSKHILKNTINPEEMKITPEAGKPIFVFTPDRELARELGAGALGGRRVRAYNQGTHPALEEAREVPLSVSAEGLAISVGSRLGGTRALAVLSSEPNQTFDFFRRYGLNNKGQRITYNPAINVSTHASMTTAAMRGQTVRNIRGIPPHPGKVPAHGEDNHSTIAGSASAMLDSWLQGRDLDARSAQTYLPPSRDAFVQEEGYHIVPESRVKSLTRVATPEESQEPTPPQILILANTPEERNTLTQIASKLFPNYESTPDATNPKLALVGNLTPKRNGKAFHQLSQLPKNTPVACTLEASTLFEEGHVIAWGRPSTIRRTFAIGGRLNNLNPQAVACALRHNGQVRKTSPLAGFLYVNKPPLLIPESGETESLRHEILASKENFVRIPDDAPANMVWLARDLSRKPLPLERVGPSGEILPPPANEAPDQDNQLTEALKGRSQAI